jgi:hypothetical protein
MKPKPVIDLVVKGGASAVFHGMSEEDIKRIMQYPFNMFASDATIRSSAPAFRTLEAMAPTQECWPSM